ncbi:MAG: glycosyltransferase family 9 protein [Pseudomonadota bacterium]
MSIKAQPEAQKILVIRRDNIGDLVCTTPLFSALRKHFPKAHLAALVNSYNAPVLRGNPDLDRVHIYRKAKHHLPAHSSSCALLPRRQGDMLPATSHRIKALSAAGFCFLSCLRIALSKGVSWFSRLAIWWQTAKLIHQLRQTRFDCIIIATPTHSSSALRFARWIGARQIIAYGRNPELPATPKAQEHESESVMRLLTCLGINEAPGALRVFAEAKPNTEAQASSTAKSNSCAPTQTSPSPALIGLHLSARKPEQRWPVERFAELAHALHARYGARFLLFWSPGAADHPQHPGDDAKAEQLQALCADLPLQAYPSQTLDELIAGLAQCSQVICSDGGAMHLAAGLGKPILCFFGNSDIHRWHPWGVVHECLQAPSRKVSDISVSEALSAFDRIQSEIAAVATKQSATT